MKNAYNQQLPELLDVANSARVLSNQSRYCSSGSAVQWAEQLVRFDKSHHSSAAAWLVAVEFKYGRDGALMAA